jgi:signal transduction histidine kinase
MPIRKKKRLRNGFSILIILIFSANLLFADNSLPYSLEIVENHEGGRLIVANEFADKICYLIKPEWIGGSEVLLTWRGIEKTNARGGSLADVDILSAIPYKDKILMVWSESEKLYIGLCDTMENLSAVSGIYSEWDGVSEPEIQWIRSEVDSKLFIRLNEILYKIGEDDDLQITFLATGVSAAYLDRQTSEIYYLVAEAGWGSIYKLSVTESNDELIYRTQILPKAEIYSDANSLFLLHYSLNSTDSQLKNIGKDGKIINEKWLETRGDLIDFLPGVGICYLAGTSTHYSLVIENHNDNSEKITEIAQNFFEPIGIRSIDEEIYLLFRNGLICFDKSGEVQSMLNYPFGEKLSTMPDFELIDNEYLVISSKKSSIVLRKQANNFWMLNAALQESGRFILPAIFIVIIIILIQLYRHNKRLLNTLLDLPSAGMVFVIDQNGKLTRANDSGKEFLGISEVIPLRRHFQYYCVMEYTKPVLDLVSYSLTSQGNFNQRISLVIDNEPREWICTVLPIRNVTGVFRGIVLTGIDITEELEKKRINNWAQLAHDMQTNLSTIRLNAEQIEFYNDPLLEQRRNKILHQVKVLIHRVRDIVTVGRTDDLDRKPVNAASICIEARVEFDEIMFPEIEFELKILNISVICDKAKMIRALRNAIENAIKAFKSGPGYIKIECYDDDKNVYFKVSDNGPGMTEEMTKKILRPYFTTAKQSGGGGIGTMIMQHVMELHGGRIDIESEVGEGTSFIFVLPIFNRDRKRKKQ